VRIRYLISLAVALLLPAPVFAQPKPELRYAVIVSRHGVRSPTWTVEQLNSYSAAPWPNWGVDPGILTVHGDKLMRQFGAWYREYFGAQGLLSRTGCTDSGRVYFRADSDQRTRATALAVAAGMFPGCPAADPHALAEGEDDALFNPFAGGGARPDPNAAVAAVIAAAGGDIAVLAERYRVEFAELDRILGKPLPAAPITLVPGRGDNPVDVTGPLRTASTLTENLLLEYTNGMSGKDLGWGRLTAANLKQVMTLHTAYADLVRRTPFIARARGSNLLAHVLDSLRQAAGGARVAGAIGDSGNRILFLSGHDTNLSNLCGMLGLTWDLPGYASGDTPPGGALVFELWRSSGKYSVRTMYAVQSLEQMHGAIPLNAQKPPLRAPLRIAGCSGATRSDCVWEEFQKVVEGTIDRSAVK
jgi:4-phytase/acid phosphatase